MEVRFGKNDKQYLRYSEKTIDSFSYRMNVFRLGLEKANIDYIISTTHLEALNLK